MIPTLRRCIAQTTKTISTNSAPYNLYPAKKVWPPDFSELSAQEQLRFEKKYKRRIEIASRRPNWDKGVQMFRFFAIGGFLLWAVTLAEFEWHGQTYKPSEEIGKSAATLWGALDPETRNERRVDAPRPPEVIASENKKL